MPTFPRLPLLDSVFPNSRTLPILQGVALVCVQHLLETTGSLIEKFVEFGFAPGNIHVLGKLYSTDESAQTRLKALGVNVYENGSHFAWGRYSSQISRDIAAMWQQALLTGAFDHVNRVIVLDDGGGNIAAVPRILVGSHSMVGVEQTMSGITLNRCEQPLIPFIGVGSSAAKVLLEPRIIQEALFHRVVSKVPTKGGTAGVVGYGYIGRAVSEGLRSIGQNVLIYDVDPDKQSASSGQFLRNIGDLYSECDTIWGCTGADHLANVDWPRHLTGNQTLISCSSKDSEFRSVLELINGKPDFEYVSRLSDVVLDVPSSSVQILGGGFPINFNATKEVEPARDIQLTRTLLFSGVLQAVYLNKDIGSGVDIDLDPSSQIRIVSRWLELCPERRSWYSDPVINVFTAEDSVRRNGSRFQRSPVADQIHPVHS